RCRNASWAGLAPGRGRLTAHIDMGRSTRKRRAGQPRRQVAEMTTGADGTAAEDVDAEAFAPPEEGGGRLLALARSLQAEDFILFAWIVLASRFFEGRLGADVATLGAGPRWLYAVVLGGLAIVFYTRGPADTDLNEASSRRCVLGLSGWFVARSYFAGDPDWMGKAFVVVFVVVLLMAPLNSLEK